MNLWRNARRLLVVGVSAIPLLASTSLHAIPADLVVTSTGAGSPGSPGGQATVTFGIDFGSGGPIDPPFDNNPWIDTLLFDLSGGTDDDQFVSQDFVFTSVIVRSGQSDITLENTPAFGDVTLLLDFADLLFDTGEKVEVDVTLDNVCTTSGGISCAAAGVIPNSGAAVGHIGATVTGLFNFEDGTASETLSATFEIVDNDGDPNGGVSQAVIPAAVTPAPEPNALALLGFGLIALRLGRNRRA